MSEPVDRPEFRLGDPNSPAEKALREQINRDVADQYEHWRRVGVPVAAPLPPTDQLPAHPAWLAVWSELRILHGKKAADYGRGRDLLANLRAAVEFGMPAWLGVALRMNDKLHRIKSFAQNGDLKNESVEDSLLDLANYAMLALVLFREGKT